MCGAPKAPNVAAHGYDIRSPLEKVMEILADFRDSIDVSEYKSL